MMVFIDIFFYFAGSVNVCKQHVKASGVEGTITGSFTADQLRTGDYECTLHFNDVPPYSVFELYFNSYSYLYNCQCDRYICNYFVIQGFTSRLLGCGSHTEMFYRYRNSNRSISIIPGFEDIAPVEFNLGYRSKSNY